MGSGVPTPTVMRRLARVRGEETRSRVLETKLIAPPVRPGTVTRADLLDRGRHRCGPDAAVARQTGGANYRSCHITINHGWRTG